MRKAIVGAAVCAALMSAGCKAKYAPPPKPKPAAETSSDQDNLSLIGFAMADLRGEAAQHERDFFTAKAESLGAVVLVEDAGGDAISQARQCENLLARNVGALVIEPVDAQALKAVVNVAHTRNAKVISYRKLIADADVDLFVSFDARKSGEAEAEALAAIVPKGRWLLLSGRLSGDAADPDAERLRQGWMKALKPRIDRGDIRIASENAGNSPAEARRILVDAIKRGRVDAVLAGSDSLAAGAISAAEGHSGLAVAGLGAEKSLCRAIWKGGSDAAVYEPPRRLAELAALQAYKITLKNGAFDSTSAFVSSGTKQTPALFAEPTTVTRANLMSGAVADGALSQADVTGAETPGPSAAANPDVTSK